MSRPSAFERELLQVWRTLQELAPEQAVRFARDLDHFRAGLEFSGFELEEFRLRGRPLAQRRAALEARGVLERIGRELAATALHIETETKATPPAAPAKDHAPPPTKDAAAPASPAPLPGTDLRQRRVIDGELEDEVPARRRRPGPASPMHGHAARTQAQLELGMAPVVRALPARGASGQ